MIEFINQNYGKFGEVIIILFSIITTTVFIVSWFYKTIATKKYVASEIKTIKETLGRYHTKIEEWIDNTDGHIEKARTERQNLKDVIIGDVEKKFITRVEYEATDEKIKQVLTMLNEVRTILSNLSEENKLISVKLARLEGRREV